MLYPINAHIDRLFAMPHVHKKRYILRIADRKFQLKYTGIFLLWTLFTIFFLSTPLYFFTRENYNLFKQAAFQVAPEILQQLEREWFWTQFFWLSASALMVAFGTILGLSITNKIATPVLLVKNHLRHLARGHWASPPLHVRHDDEFNELVQQYNYFFLALQSATQNELQFLNELQIPASHRTIYDRWQELIETKKAQLGQ